MTNAIEIRGLTKRYGPVLALDHLDLDIEKGEVFGLLGPNGAGKSTTLRLLLGFARPTDGTARIAGFDSVPSLRATLCYVPLAAAFGGLGLAVYGVAPRATQGLIATLVAVASIIELVASLTTAPSWFLDISPFFHLGNAPAEAARPVPALLMLAFGAAAAVFGVEAFARRDLIPM